MRVLRITLATMGLALLVLAALAGVALSAGSLWARTPAGREFVAGRAVGLLDQALAGRFELGEVSVLPSGAVEISDLRVFDPEERLVLSVSRARVSADVTRLRSRVLALELDLESPFVLLDEDEAGGISLARAFTPTEPSAPDAPSSGPTFTVRVSRLRVRGGAVWWRDAGGDSRLQARDLEVDARGGFGPSRADVDLRLGAVLDVPVTAPFALQVRASRRDDLVSLPLLSASAGTTVVHVVGEGDLGRRSGRVALTRLAVDRGLARKVAPGFEAGGDLLARAFGESDGTLATAAVVASAAGERGTARAALAVRLGDLGGGRTRAAGLDVALDALDPSRLLEKLPPGSVSLTARGAAAGSTLSDLGGKLDARLARSTLRGVPLGPGELQARAARGAIDVGRFSLVLPGASLEGSGRWRRQGAVSGRAVLDASDAGALARSLARLSGEPDPLVSGGLRVEADLAGTAREPRLVATLTAPALGWEANGVRGLSARVELAGPLSAPGGRVELSADALRSEGEDAVRRVELTAGLAGREAEVKASGAVPRLGREPVALAGKGTLDERREQLVVSELDLGWPGDRWTLVAPATVTFAGPVVDRLQLAAGDQRLSFEGGLTGRRLDVEMRASRLDLARLPRGLLPEGTAGRVTLEAAASGAPSAPTARVAFEVADVTAAGLEGLSGRGEAGWDGRARRARLIAEVARKAGGRVEVDGELPVPLATRRPEPVRLRALAEAIPVWEALDAAGLDLPFDGKAGVEIRLDGTTAAPTLTAAATLGDAAWDDLFPVDARVAVEAPGETLMMNAELSVDGRRALRAEAALPFELAEALARPEQAAAALLAAPLRALAEVPSFDLAAVAGAVGVPRDLRGTLDGRAELSGTLAAPRGTVWTALSGGAVAGYRELGARVEAELLAREVRVAAGASLAGAELVRATGAIEGAPEALAGEAALARAPFRLAAELPGIDLAKASSPAVVLGGRLAGKASAEGTLAAPVVDAALAGQDLTVQGRPLGALEASARHAAGRSEASLTLRPRTGGSLRATGTLDAHLGLGASDDLARAPLDAHLVADALDLGFLPAVAPGVVREARGKLEGEIRLRGTPVRPSPRGRLLVADGRLGVAEFGDWTGLGLDLEVNDDALLLRTLEGRRGKGRFQAQGSVRGLATPSAVVTASARLDALTVARAGMDFATLDLSLTASGTWDGAEARMEVRVPGGTIQLPRRIPRTLQTLERRRDIEVGRPRERRRPPRSAGEEAGGAATEAPLRLVVRTLVPGQLFVKGEEPRTNVELKADVTYELSGVEGYASGELSVIRGFVEPLGGRVFDISRGSVQFTGGPPSAALVDVEARWKSADGTLVTARVYGPALAPQIKLESQPQYDEAQLALLIATGRTELKRGSGEVASLSATEAASQALSAVVSTAFKRLLSDKLPIDTISLDASTVRAGTYLPNSKIYVGYVYRFEAAIEKGENQNEVSVEYQITPRWTLESRYGDGQSGSASLVWSREY